MEQLSRLLARLESGFSRRADRSAGSRVVFLISPTQRSGTNFVRNILETGSACCCPENGVLRLEDWILHSSPHLIDFCDALRERWGELAVPESVDQTALASGFRNAMGEALSEQIVLGIPEGHVIVKTPSSKNVANVFSLFPDSKLIFVIRDGRDACQSLIKSKFVKGHKAAFQHWADHVDEILHFHGQVNFEAQEGNILWVRYEDAVKNPAGTLSQAAHFLGQPAGKLTAERLDQLMIYGSSQYAGSGGEFEYKNVPSIPDFKPIGRWLNWPDDWCEEFKEIAGDQLIKLGYEKDKNWSVASGSNVLL